MSIVIKWNGKKEVGIDKDGKEYDDYEKTPTYNNHKAKQIAKKYGGNVEDVEHLLDEDYGLQLRKIK